MAQAQQSAARPAHRAPTADHATLWFGWVVFAGLVMITAGLLNMIQGIVALFHQDYYVTTRSGLVVDVGYPAWGWALLAFGVLIGLTGYGIIGGGSCARVVGVLLVAIDAVLNFIFLPAYPIWGTLAVALDVVVIYALTVHGRGAGRPGGSMTGPGPISAEERP